MSDYVDVEIPLKSGMWNYIIRLAKMNNTSVSRLVNDIIDDELDRLDGLDEENDSSQRVERNDKTGEDSQENSE